MAHKDDYETLQILQNIQNYRLVHTSEFILLGLLRLYAFEQ